MYIEFDCYFPEQSGIWKAPNLLSHTQLKQMFQRALNTAGRENLIGYFVDSFGFKRVESTQGIQPDFVIDLDTDRVYRPWY